MTGNIISQNSQNIFQTFNNETTIKDKYFMKVRQDIKQ
jgi:hypothetical protein